MRVGPTVQGAGHSPGTTGEPPLFGGGVARRRTLRRRVLVAMAGVLAVVLVAGTVFVLTQRNVTTSVSLDDAVEVFRERREVEEPNAAKADRAATAQAPVPAKKRDAASAPDAAKRERKTVTAASYVLPTEGVYAYKTTGGERLSTFGARHDYPERTFATVNHVEGCVWEQQNQVIEEHVDVRRFCAGAGKLEQLFYEARVTFFGQTDGGGMRCEPPAVFHRAKMEPGHDASFRCGDGDGTSAKMIVTYVGVDALRIGSETVKTRHITVTATLSGRIEGTSFSTLWLHPTNGLTLRWERTNENVATAFGTRVRYEEEATFLLESLDPLR